tara:strand:+ start:1681 stop:1947 length:267 start_codon:yes stop_codon:yes gene_type:complete
MVNASSPFAIWFVLFALAGYFIVTDPSVSKAFYYVLELLQVKYKKTMWWLIHNPSNPIVKWMIYRKNLKLAKELRAKIDKKLAENEIR